MSHKHRSKSGSTARRQAKPATRGTPGASLSLEARHILDEGMKVATSFEAGGLLAQDTIVERFVQLITRHGVIMCWAALQETMSRPNQLQRDYWRGPAFCALAKLGMLKEAYLFMSRLKFRDEQRVGCLSMMSDYVDGAALEEILSKLEVFAESASDETIRIGTQFRLFSRSHDRYEHLIPSLKAALGRCIARAESLNEYEAGTMVGTALFWPEEPALKETILVVPRIRDSRARDTAEYILFAGLETLYRDDLEPLAEAVVGTEYEGRIRELAKNARTFEERESENEHAPTEEALSTV